MNELILNSKKRLGEIPFLSKIYHETRLRRLMRTQQGPILVHQMGKVGSRSIVDSLKAMNINRPVYHMHFLNPASLERADHMLHEIYGNHYNVNRWCLYESRFVIKHLLQDRDDLKIISLVRDPIARNLSSFFYNIDMFIPGCAALYDQNRISLTEVRQTFLDRFHEHHMPLTWFDEEIGKVFGMDVFSMDFSILHQHAFAYRYRNLNLLVLKTEHINTVAQAALQQFLEVEDFRLKLSNVSSEKNYSRVYSDFVKTVQLPDEYLTAMYESKYVRYFYKPEEIRRFRRHWSRQ